MISAIIFDVGGVLVKCRVEQVFERLAEKLSLDCSAVEKFRLKHKNSLNSGNINSSEFAEMFRKEFGLKGDFLKQWEETYFEVMPVNEDLLEVASRLRKNYALCLITNTNDLHFRINKARGMLSPFDVIIASHEVGLFKPQKEIFELALKKLGLSASQCIFIDDRKEHLEIPASMGFKVICFENNEQLLRELGNLGVAV